MKRTTANIFYLFLRWCPGGLGLYLRQRFYPLILKSCGRKVLFGRFVNFFNPDNVSIGNNVIISDNVTFDTCDYSGPGPAIILRDNVFVGAKSTLRVSSGKIVIEKEASIGSFCSFNAAANINVDNDVLLAAFCHIGNNPDQNFEKNTSSEITEKLATGEVNIAAGCWLGVRCVILPGVSIGEGTIIGAHALVEKSLPPYVIAFGRPAEVTRNRF